MKRLEKKWAGFWAVVAAAATGEWALWLFSRALGAVGAAAGVVFLIWWSIYFAKLNYRLDNRSIVIQSGIVFRKEITIPIVNILRCTRVSFYLGRERKMALLTLLHTSGGKTVIFADYSTNS